jgi:hypothetical protein
MTKESYCIYSKKVLNLFVFLNIDKVLQKKEVCEPFLKYIKLKKIWGKKVLHVHNHNLKLKVKNNFYDGVVI